ncbi:PilN domain-containing protein [uncultured Abyssibacter sp.]|uniref:PilN domain-containing protein n=1 Tax=uncultured Abyssibacter sp. TaxID=2320202 RepID=UPI0032B2C10F
MKRINLLDWREERRDRLKKQFAQTAIGGALVAALLVYGGMWFMNGAIEHQNKRNNMLKSEIKAIDRKIKEIEELERVKANLLARMRIIEELQASRSQTVHFFDEIVNTLPDGVFLTLIRQQGQATTIEGVAESNGRVSTYMKNLDASEWFSNPRLVVIKTSSERGGTGRSSQFTLQVKNVRPSGDNASEDDS